MVSKGIQIYAGMSGPSFGVSCQVPDESASWTGTANPSGAASQAGTNQQVESSNLPWYTFVGAFNWQALHNGQSVVSGSQEIDSLTGNLDSGSMVNQMNTPSTVASNYAVSYGFYDAGSAVGSPLSNQDQFYCYTTDCYTAWMADLTKALPQLAAAPFSSFVLPGAHDSGMCTTATASTILNSPASAAILAAMVLYIPGLGAVAAVLTETQGMFAVQNIAITQKDTISTMLALGIRFFDFRPGYLYGPIQDDLTTPNVLYHQHAVIPGLAYSAFLSEVFTFLVANPGEIVVVDLNSNGYSNISSAMVPTDEQLSTALTSAQGSVSGASAIATGGPASLSQTYTSLIASNTRLIFLNEIDGTATRNDSYSWPPGSGNSNNVTTNPSVLTNVFQEMLTTPVPATFTMLQMQATATGLGIGVLAPAVMTESYASSPVMATKGQFDSVTIPWLAQNAGKFPAGQLVVLLNDFAENLTVSTAISATAMRVYDQTVSAERAAVSPAVQNQINAELANVTRLL